MAVLQVMTYTFQGESYSNDNITAVTASPANEEIDLCELYWSEGLYNKHQGNFLHYRFQLTLYGL